MHDETWADWAILWADWACILLACAIACMLAAGIHDLHQDVREMEVSCSAQAREARR